MSEQNGIKYLTPPRAVSDIQREARRNTSAQEVAALMFVKMAQEEQFDETTISEHPDLFVQWSEFWRGKKGDIVQDEGQLYRSIHDVNDAGQNRKPSETPSMWTRIGNPLEAFPEWVQPDGAHAADEAGSKVSHNGKKGVSTAPAHVWEPGVYGWEEYSEPVAQMAQEAPREPQDGPSEEPGE